MISFYGSKSNIIKYKLNEINKKPYYSQLPYAIGDKYAFKFEFIYKGQTLKRVDGSEVQNYKSFIDWIRLNFALSTDTDGKMYYEYDFNIQILERNSENEDLINKRAYKGWDSKRIRVGSLIIKKGFLINESNMNLSIKNFLDKNINFPDTIKEANSDKSDDLY